MTRTMASSPESQRQTREQKRESPIVEHARQLQGLELLAARSTIGNIVVAELGGQVSPGVLQQAGFRVQRRHPALRARFVFPMDHHQRPRVEFCEPDVGRVGFEELRSGAGYSDADVPLWVQVAINEANRDFASPSGYAFRIVWVPRPCEGGHMIIGVPQALVDGASLMCLLHDLLRETAELTQDPALQRFNADVLDPLPPSPTLSDLRPLQVHERVLAKALAYARRVRTSATTHEDLGSTGANSNRSQRRITCCRFKVGTPKNVRGIRQACEEQKTTVSHALAAAVQFAAIRMIWKANGYLGSGVGRFKFPLTVGCDLRPSPTTPVPRRERLASFESASEVSVPIFGGIRFWELARTLTRRAGRAWHSMPLLSYYAPELLTAAGASPSPGSDASRQSMTHGLHVSQVETYPYPTRIGPIELRSVCRFAAGVPWGLPHGIYLTDFGDSFQYVTTSMCPPADRDGSANLLDNVATLMDRCDSRSLTALSLTQYANDGL